MKLTLLPVCGILALNILRATAWLLRECKDLDPNKELIRFSNETAEEVTGLADWCRQCRRHNKCSNSHGFDRDSIPSKTYVSICQCLAVVKPRPIYLIANRVLSSGDVAVALDHGANAIEIDVTAWSEGWWADSRGLAGSSGDPLSTMLQAIAEAVKGGRYVGFVWLEIRNPSYCDLWTHPHCAVTGLRDLVREHLDDIEVPVLYSFTNTVVRGTALAYIAQNLNSREAVALRGMTNTVDRAFKGIAKELPEEQRVMSYGYWDWATGFYSWMRELETGVRSQAFQRVFGWTYAGGMTTELDYMLDTGVDGLVYGFKDTAYYDHEDVRTAAQDIKEWVARHPARARIAKKGDRPW